MDDGLKKFMEDCENGKIEEKESNLHLIIMYIFAFILLFVAFALCISYHCF